MAGKIVKIQSSSLFSSFIKIGKTKNSDNPINGKIMVYMENGTKLLVKPEKITVIGFYD